MIRAIAQSDRALVDAFIGAGRVTRVPLGVSGIDAATGKPWPTIDAAISAHRAWMARLPEIPGAGSDKPHSRAFGLGVTTVHRWVSTHKCIPDRAAEIKTGDGAYFADDFGEI